MGKDSDWRLQGQEAYLQGITLVHRRYRQYARQPNWDHDHCVFCTAKFVLGASPECQQQGYASEDDYWWVCEACFTDFKERFAWRVVEAMG